MPLQAGRRALLGSALSMVTAGALSACTGSRPTGPRGAKAGRTVGDPVAHLRTSWSTDPFARCSYSYLAPGPLGAGARTRLAAPVAGRVYFAGEATSSEAPSTAHGALESGRRAAAQIAAVAGAGEHVVVVGAGLAGLGCARALADQGFPVTVLEGRGRIGGRVWTRHLGEVPAEMGASWIHGSRGNVLTEVLREVGDPGRPFDYDNTRGEDEAATGEIARREERLGDVEDPDTTTVASRMPSRPSPALRTAVNIEFPLEYGAEPGQLSVTATQEGRDPAGPDLLLPRGYERLVAHVRGDLPVRTRQVVTGVRYGPDSASVVLRSGETLPAGRVVVTVPIGVLKAGSIRFDPALPEPTRQAVAAIGAGLLDKLWLRFDEPFWDTGADVLEWFDPEHPSLWSWWVNGQKFFGAPVLLGLNGGAQAHALARLSDDEVVAGAMTALRRMHVR
ncbi:FAD-dependent oxidoreductase [Streptomyces sp. NPDC001781]